MKKIITKLNDYFYQTAFAVLLFISFFIFKDFWVECLNKFWVDPIAEKINNNNIYIIPFAIIITYYIKQWIVTKTYNTKRLMFYIAFVVINVLCYFSGYWQYTSKWTTLLIILPLICEIILDVKIYCKRKFSKQITPELEIEKTKNIEDSYNRQHIYDTTYETLKTCFYEEGSFAVSISGAWGSGKTVFKEQLKKNYEKNNKISIIEFEAWKCDSPTIIIRNFFTQLKDKLKIYFPNISIDFNNYIDLLLDNDSVKPLRIIAKGVNNLLNKDKDPFDTIKNYLKESKHKVVVFIDDVDRLDADEIKEVLRLIRNTANFPYIQFIVTCDNDYVCDTLKKKGIENPKLYLEKFFNLEISLPKFEERIICEELEKNILKIFSEQNIEQEGYSDQTIRIHDAIYKELNNSIDFNRNLLIPLVLKSMRDVIRFCNSFKLLFKMYIENKDNQKNGLKIEFENLFFLELLKYRFPKIYTSLSDSTLELFDCKSKYYRLKSEKDVKDIITKLLNNNDNIEVAFAILKELFEKNNLEYSINKYQYFDIYFMYRLDKKRLTRSEFLTLIDSKDDNDFINKVNDWGKNKYQNEFHTLIDDILYKINRNNTMYYSVDIQETIIRILVNNEIVLNEVIDEISKAIINHLKNGHFYNTIYLKFILKLFNSLKSDFLKDFNSLNFIHSILIKEDILKFFKNTKIEYIKGIITNFLYDTPHTLIISSALSNFMNIQMQDNKKSDLLIDIKELSNIQVTYFEKHNDKFSEVGETLFKNCEIYEKINNLTIIDNRASRIMKTAIYNTPNNFFKIFIKHFDSKQYHFHTEVRPFYFYEQIFGSKEEFKQFLNSCNSNSIEETRVKNFWRLFKNNNYENLQFDNQAINIQEMINNCFKEQIKQLEELESIKQEIEKSGKINQANISSFSNNPLKIALWSEINNKIIEIKQKESAKPQQ
jgi:hypothetical protein